MKRALLFLVVLSCGGGQTHPNLFKSDWEDDSGRTIEAVRMRLGSARPVVGPDVAVGVAGNADKVVGLPIGGKRWTFAHALDVRPIVAGQVVVGSGGGEVFALDATSGHKLWSRPTGGLALRGAGDDGSVTVMTFAQAGNAGSTLLAILRDGASVRQIETDKALGSPAVVNGMAFVPWANQYVSVIDLSNGNEAARVVLREKTTRAWTQSGGVYFGELGVIRFDDRIRMASRNQASRVGLPKRELPASPPWMLPGGEPVPPVAGAKDKVRIFGRPGPLEAPLALDQGRYCASYFRLLMGLDAKKGDIAWIGVRPATILGGAAAPGGVVTCDETGKVHVFDARTGQLAAEHDMGEPVKSCVVQIETLTVPAPASPGKPLAVQLEEAVLDGDAQLAAADRLLLKELASLEDETVTRTLIRLAMDVRSPPELRSDARAALATRRSGEKFMIEALRRHYDFLREVGPPPPVGPLAQALAAIKDPAAGPALASHLMDPANSEQDLKQAADALAAIAGPSELSTLKLFFAMYRATAEGDEMATALVSVALAIQRLGERALLENALKDAATLPFLRERLAEMLKVEPAPADPKSGEKPGKDTEPKK